MPGSLNRSGLQVHIVDGNRLPANNDRLAESQGFHTVPPPGRTIAIHAPDSALTCGFAASGNSNGSERMVILSPLEHFPASDDYCLWRLSQRSPQLASRLTPKPLPVSKREPETKRTNANRFSGFMTRAHDLASLDDQQSR
jgi:hypothetical protein